MAAGRGRTGWPPAARELADLPWAPHLTGFSGELEREGDYDTVLFEGGEHTGADCGNARFVETAFESTGFDAVRFRRARFNDVWLHQVRMVGCDLAETNWLDAEWSGGLLAGLEFYGAPLRRVVFRNCKLDSVNLRTAELREVAFVDCLLREVDFGGATLTDVSFPGSTLERALFQRARLKRVDLREAAALGITSGWEDLRGATISSPQLLDLAPALADSLGLLVQDEGQPT
ncbi:pentapeptide repeat-containing protein [Phaeacidiphilus oryzae]|uniref:pentapeptide repeat-containing protein n=1 Tax=Phaeacidiphilus oryzae TaxID=348818 RepID=UPI00068B1359|nr:pentapeptide repeat-containing protein [Phaeacidiphilus oryzae]